VKFIDGLSFILFMHKMCTYCLSKAHLGVLKVSLCVYRVFGFFRCYLTFSRLDLAFFAYDYMATLTESLHSQSLSFKTHNIYLQRHIHACNLKTVQKQKSTMLI